MYHYDGLRVIHVATHHKTGSVWFMAVFRDFARRAGLHMVPLWMFRNNPEHHLNIARNGRGVLILFSQTGAQTPEDLALGPALHIVRDPREMLISAMDYHLEATEGFLRRGWPGLPKGVTYQQHLRELPDFEARLGFELSAFTARTFDEMRNWIGAGQNVFTLRYEDAIHDRQMTVFGHALRHMGFSGADFAIGLAALHNNSLFGGLSGARARAAITPGGTAHIRSDGTRKWQLLPRPVAEAIARDHGDLLAAYGYAEGDNWLSQLLSDA